MMRNIKCTLLIDNFLSKPVLIKTYQKLITFDKFVN
jgi:hypothetical protein